MTSEQPGPELDTRRARVATLELTGAAVAALSPLVRTLPIDALTPVKQLLKQYFSDRPWTGADDDTLAAVVGPRAEDDDAAGTVALAPGLVLAWGWPDGRFRLRLLDRSASTDG